jgi:hypothetical protein
VTAPEPRCARKLQAKFSPTRAYWRFRILKQELPASEKRALRRRVVIRATGAGGPDEPAYLSSPKPKEGV